MNQKKRPIISLTICMLLLVLSLSACSAEKDEYVFGAVVALSGPISFYGEFMQHGYELAIEDINANGGINGKPVRIIYEDSASSRSYATTAARKLATIDNVDALFTGTTPLAGAVAPIAEEHGIPLVYASATNSFAEGTQYVFKDYPNAFDICKILAEEAIALGHESIGLFGSNAEFTILCKEGMEEVTDLAFFETYTPGDKDIRSPLTKAKETGITAFFIPIFAGDCITTYNQMKELDYKPQLFLPFQQFGCGTEELSKDYASLLADARGGDLNFDGNSKNPLFLDIKERLEERGWTTHIVGSAMMYDTVIPLANAFEGCTDKDCVIENMRQTSYNGASGGLKYKGQQIVSRDLRLTKFNDGEWKVLETWIVE